MCKLSKKNSVFPNPCVQSLEFYLVYANSLSLSFYEIALVVLVGGYVMFLMLLPARNYHKDLRWSDSYVITFANVLLIVGDDDVHR